MLVKELVLGALDMKTWTLSDSPVMADTLGGVIGIGLFAVCSKMLGERTVRILNILASVGTVVTVVFLVLLIAANM